jgi:type VI secretion system protein
MTTHAGREGLPVAATRVAVLRSCLRTLLLALGVTFALASCGVTTKVRSAFGGELPFRVTVAPDANENSAIAVDLVVVYDNKVLDQLLKLKSTEWFARKQQFLNDYSNELAVKGWEWIPSQVVEEQFVPYRSGARKVVLFADYHTDGEHRASVDPQMPFHLTLGPLDMTLEAAQ